MDALQFDTYSTYSDGSTPRTPSPGSSLAVEDTRYQHSPGFFKPATFDAEPMPTSYGRDDHGYHDMPVGVAPEWASPHHPPTALPPRGGGLLQELYEPDMPHHSAHHPHEMYLDHSAEPHYGGADWGMHHHPHPAAQHSLPPMRSRHDGMARRNTFPYVHHDHEHHMYSHPPPPPYPEHPPMMSPYGTRGDVVYGEPMPMHGSPHVMAADPSALHGEPYPGSHMASPHAGYVQLEEGIKMEDGTMMVPSQGGFYRPPSTGMPMPYHISPHTGIPIQHTDDAASKETQYLRRRCFNCHTTEPPSWRRSTLNPGKIVCNKCGLYERTHLRPRPLRFDELRAGNKARKNSKATPPAPKQRPVKKEHMVTSNEPISRRASVSSNASSVGGSSDWDDSVSVYSGSSAPGSSFNSPAQPTFPLSRESASPPMHSQDGIRLPNGGLSDIGSAPSSGCQIQPRKAASSPQQQYFTPADAYARRNTVNLPPLPSSAEVNGRPRSVSEVDLPEATGWQSVPMSDVPPTPEKSTPRSKAVAVA